MTSEASIKKTRLQRTEGNVVYNILTCAPLIIVSFFASPVVGIWYPAAADVVFGVLVIPSGCFYLWFIGWLIRGRWYLEYDESTLLYRTILFSYRCEWKDVGNVRSYKSEAFMGKYHDTFVIEVLGKTMEFFLPDFGLSTKKKAVYFIEAITETWGKANPSAATKTKGERAERIADDADDEFDEES